MKKEKMELAVNLLKQIIQKAKEEDVEFKRRMIEQHQGEKAIGESWMVFHLKALQELLESGN